MAFAIKGPTTTVRIDDVDAPILELPDRLGKSCQVLERIARTFDARFEVCGTELRQCRAEVFDLLDAFRALKEDQLSRLDLASFEALKPGSDRAAGGSKPAEDPLARATMLDQIMRRNPVHAQLEALHACAQEALAADECLRCGAEPRGDG
ncbi:MAG: hypothetical protein AB8H80_19665 [Planctomycetota bacterium]